MRKFPRNVWTSRLNEHDWNFSACPIGEWQSCFHWEFAREYFQRKHDGQFPANRPYRALSDEEIVRRGGGYNGPEHWIWHPHFPASSYLEMRRKENFHVDKLDEDDSSCLISYQWNHADQLREQSDVDSYGGCWAGKTATVHPFYIPWEYPVEILEKAFRDWLRNNRPHYSVGEGLNYKKGAPIIPEQPVEAKKTGAASEVRQWKTKLKNLSAWRVLQHHRGNVHLAVNHPNIKSILGKQFLPTKKTVTPTAWVEAKKSVEKILQENFASTEMT